MALRDRLTRPPATAIPAIPATDAGQDSGSIAKIAAIAVASPESIGRPATAAETVQLRGLLARHLGDGSPELAEALAVALRDPVASLRTLRASFPPNCTYAENAALRELEDFTAYVRGPR